MEKFNDTFTYQEVDFDIEYYYTPEEPMVMYYADGSGYPGSSAEVEILKIEVMGYDMWELLNDYVIEALTDLIIENH